MREEITFSYRRLSNDPGGRRADHVTQRRHITEVCHRERLPLPAVERDYGDDDRSASKLTQERPGWLALCKAMRSVDATRSQVVLIASARDRLTRRVEDLPGLFDLIEELGGRLITARDGEITVTTGGRDAGIFGGAVDHLEADRIKKRTRDGCETAGLEGKRHGAVPWGWRYEITGIDRHGATTGHDVVDAEAREILLGMARRVLRGVSLHAIVRELNDAGIPAPGAGRVLRRDKETQEPVKVARGDWTTHAVRHVLTRKANIGVRIHRPGHGIDRTPRETRAAWPALMDEGTYAQVCAVLEAEDRRSSRTNIASHLCSGIARCSVCGNTMQAWISKQARPGAPRYTAYACRSGHVTKTEALVDGVVEAWLLAWLSQPEVRRELTREHGTGTDDVLSRLQGARSQADMLAEMWADRANTRMSPAQFTIMNSGIQDEIAQLESELAHLRDTEVLSIVTAEDVSAAWEGMSISERRAVISALVEITLMPSTRRGRSSFDPATVLVEPRVTPR